jgi:uridine monophosphate synthetase
LPKYTSTSFVEKLTRSIDRNDTLLCVGLDPDPKNFPAQFPKTIDAEALVSWGRAIIEQTSDLVCCYKPNYAFYEQYGPPGLEALRRTIALIPDDIPVLLDVKRGDIGSTAAAYARAAFEVWGADAVTVNPYLGQDSIAPYLAYPGKMAFILCYTSNPSAAEIQEFGGRDERLFEHIIRQGQEWGRTDQIGFVIGATQPHALASFRRLSPDRSSWILAPGIGAQGGELSAALAAGLDSKGGGLIIPVSRSVIYAQDPRAAAQALRDTMNRARRNLKPAQPVSSAQTELILQLYETGCIQFGRFSLVSGQQSPIYLDLRRLTARPLLLRMAARAYAALLKPLSFDHLAAVPYAALTIATAVALTTNSSLIYPRKEVKAHGTGQTVEGVFSAGEKVVIIEDLVTTGGSVLRAIEALKTAGLAVSDVAVLIDREQGGREILAESGYRLHTALRLSDILETLREAGRISAEQVAEVKKFHESVS